jgi:protein-L-isoaspartate O-methyltransferase
MANRLIAIALLFTAPLALSAQDNEKVPYVPTPIEVVDRMLEYAEVKATDIVYDIGSGDGRIVIQAAKKYGARGVGIDFDRRLVDLARAAAKRENVEHLVEFRHQDALQADISPATVVTLYMLPSFNRKLRPVLERQLRPGTRVVAHDYPVEGWNHVKWEEMALMDTRPEVEPHNHVLYLYRWKSGKK